LYAAELKGKLSLSDEKKEDVLTSNVFSFFKYSTRKIFLKEYLRRLGFSVTDNEVETAEFLFWPRYEENTEPDLVLIVGIYYLLFEAKYFSDFGQETVTTRSQLIREITGGMLDAKAYQREFHLIAITADHYHKPWKFESIPHDLQQHLQWTNWQMVSRLLYDMLKYGWDLNCEDRDFAQDLYYLLDKKNLRNFFGTHLAHRENPRLAQMVSIFFEAKTARHRGDFIGFLPSLSVDQKVESVEKCVFFNSGKAFFEAIDIKPLLNPCKTIFWGGDKDDE
jgi:hypothetical protein